ncbi:MAG: haloalkane dehalogenase [Chloroflexi bacterium]|nr:haloalkane dehalogenase [Chloroflexota bacterium]
MDFLRTPDDRFNNLPDYPFAPKYLEVPAGDGDNLRMHYVDEGPPEAPPVLMLHGEPSWSFLYRKMIPPIVAAEYRVIAPDLIGFGRSDKPLQQSDYSYQRHMDWLNHFVESLELQGITLFCQDWGGLLGLRLVGEQPHRFERVIAANTFLPTGETPMSRAFMAWRAFSQLGPGLPVARILNTATATPLAPEVVAAYEAPFPDNRYKAGAKVFPMLVPIKPDDPGAAENRAAWGTLERWEKPFLTAFGDSDPITRPAAAILQQRIPGAKGQAHVTINNAGHFLQEDQGERLAEIILDFIKRTR